MENTIPNMQQLEKHLGDLAFSAWNELTKFIERHLLNIQAFVFTRKLS